MIGKKIKYEIREENKYSQETGIILDKVLVSEYSRFTDTAGNYHVYLVRNDNKNIEFVNPLKIIDILDDN